MKISLWSNGKMEFTSSYERDGVGERVFVLTAIKIVKGIKRRITFESWQAAKKAGWVKNVA